MNFRWICLYVSLNQETINNISGDRISHNGRLGAGAGLTYYATFGQAGAGLDIRITPHWGFFADARYVMPQHVDNFGVGRAGILRLLLETYENPTAASDPVRQRPGDGSLDGAGHA